MPVPDFIVEIRKLIGHHPLWLPGVTGLVLDDDGRLLLGQRSDSGLWALPSGIPEPGEEMAGACAREILEETGVEVVVDELIGIETTPSITYPNGDVTQYVSHLFRCYPSGGEAHVADDESLAVGWFDRSGLPEPRVPSLERTLEIAEQQAGSGRAWFTAQ